MATAELIPGARFRLYREIDGQAGQFAYVGLATTLSFTTSLELEDYAAIRPDNPTAPRPAEYYVRGSAWEISFAGRVDAAAFELIEDDQRKRDPHVYRVLMGAAGKGRSYAGPVFFEQLSRQMQERGFVSFSASCRGSGGLTVADI